MSCVCSGQLRVVCATLEPLSSQKATITPFVSVCRVILSQFCAEILIGMEQATYSINEGDTVDVCAVVLGPEQISEGLEAFATLTAVPDTADGESRKFQVYEQC